MKEGDLLVKKIVILMVIFLMISIPISNALSLEDIMQQGDAFLETGKENGGDSLLNEGELQNATNDIYNILLTLGVVISVAVGAILGVKYITGSVDEQAKIKETMMPYVIGCFVVFGAFGIWKITINSLQNIIIPSKDQNYIWEQGYWTMCIDCNRELTDYEIDVGNNSEPPWIRCLIDNNHKIQVERSRVVCAVCGYPGTTATCRWCPKGYAAVKGVWLRCATCNEEIETVEEAQQHQKSEGHSIGTIYERCYCLTCHKHTKYKTYCSECGTTFNN